MAMDGLSLTMRHMLSIRPITHETESKRGPAIDVSGTIIAETRARLSIDGLAVWQIGVR